jgi:hypothetical protein
MTMQKSSSWEFSDESVTLTLIYSSKICANSDLNIQDLVKFDAHLEYVIIFLIYVFIMIRCLKYRMQLLLSRGIYKLYYIS